MSEAPSPTATSDRGAGAASPWVIRAETVAAHSEAVAIREAARRDALRLREAAMAAADAIRADAAAELARAVAEGVAARLRRFETELAAWQTAREAELLPLAFAVAARIVGALPANVALERAARTALGEHAGTARLALRTDPATAAVLRERLGDLAVAIRADENLPPGDCVLVHPQGQVAVSPAAQLRALQAGAMPSAGGVVAP